jgi:dolichol-phosphate mannosyltransferase
VFVDDHSTDQTPDLLKTFCKNHLGYSYLRLSSNSGSHIAILAGLAHTRGDCAVFLAADLQDPPELIPQMVERWQSGHHIVWAVRADREGISWLDKTTSKLFYWLLNRMSAMNFPPQGTDFALIDRAVLDGLLRSVGANPSIALEIARLGFNQTHIEYLKAPRQFGATKWNLERKLKAFADAFVSTSYVPLRLISYLGLFVSMVGFLYAVFLVVWRFIVKNPIEGWTTLMVGILIFGGLQMIMLGILGEYLWRTLEQARRRPHFFLEDWYGLENMPESQNGQRLPQEEQIAK